MLLIPYTANFQGGKRLCTKHTIHWKTFAVHQAHAIMYCTQQMIQGENFRDWLKNRENRESFPPLESFAVYGMLMVTQMVIHCNFKMIVVIVQSVELVN